MAYATGEAIGARWDEIDLGAKAWTIPAERMKGGREHRVPLSAPVVELLQALPCERGNQFVFIGARNGALGRPLPRVAAAHTLIERQAAIHFASTSLASTSSPAKWIATITYTEGE